jgi:hypothetical protein
MRAVSLEKLLPADVPEGEQILWHGRPQWVSLARRAYRADFIAAYFVALTVWSLWSTAEFGWSAAALAGAKTLGIGAAALAIVAGLAFLSARTTLYVVTSRRLVLKVGIALPVFINLPFKDIASAAARVYSDGTGDIPLALLKGRRIGYWLLWPSARPFHLLRPQPCLRCVADAAVVAATVGAALRGAAGQAPAPVAAVRDAKAEPRAEALTLTERAAA